jgi:nucleoside diphosphate kinase
MSGARKVANYDQSLYATGSDFCRIFKQDMNHLYLLSRLLAGDHAGAEKCFVRGLEDSMSSNPVFVEWAQSWAVRKIVQNAIEMIHPRPANSNNGNGTFNLQSDNNRERAITEPAEIVRILAMPAFERFAFVLSVLERLSDQDCAVLLACTTGELVEARTRGLQQIGNPAEQGMGVPRSLRHA